MTAVRYPEWQSVRCHGRWLRYCRRVDRELLEETASLGAIAVRVGCGKSSVKRHADRHLKPAVKAEVQRIEAGAEVAPPTPPKPGDPPDIRRGVRPVVERLYERCAEWADRAKDDSSWPMFVACVREARQSAELVARLNGELDSFQAGATTVNQYILVPPTLPLPPAPRPAVVVEIQAASENTQDEGRDLT